jgi:Ser/Thr protein kinase RdoA (MazF antagonist)
MTPFEANGPPVDSTAPDTLGQLLAARFAITAIDLARLPVGQATVNYRATTDSGTLFVKAYPAGTNLARESAAIELSALAGQAGVPVARPLPAREDTFIATHAGSAASVWEYVDGEIIESDYTRAQLHAVGHTLGVIHRFFAALPASGGPAPQAASWLAFDAARFTARINRLLGILGAKDRFDEFDRCAAETLLERRAQAARIPSLIAGLPPLDTQVLHGDFSRMNLMFKGDHLAAVIDFGPPDPFFPAYELGRIAYDPRTVTHAPGWQTDAAALITAYWHANPAAAPDTTTHCARVALIQLLTSLYGVNDHYLKPGQFQSGLDTFWLLRHRAATELLSHLDELESTPHT